jgi:hypothetical protein
VDAVLRVDLQALAGTVLEGHELVHTWQQIKSKSKSRYDWRSVSQYVVAPSQLWDLWPDVTSCPSCFRKVAVLSLTRGRVCHLSVSAHAALQILTFQNFSP